jgi:putative nucleotidyltransferase with HDIG domain
MILTMAASWSEPITLPPTPLVGEGIPRLGDHAGSLPIFEEMASCPQEPEYHGEGDVLTHTEMVCRELVADVRWQALDEMTREEMWWAALLHDCGKPQTTRYEDGRLRSPYHAARGAVLARSLLWRAGVPPLRRERVCALVAHHMLPYHLLDRDDPERALIEASLGCPPSLLALLTSADSRGRLARDGDHLGDAVDAFAEMAQELGCPDGPYPFASDHARVMYFRRDGRSPSYAAYDDSRGVVTLTSGLPGAGKDAWASRHGEGARVVSLDDLRRSSGVKRGDRKGEGRLYAQAREALREEMRAGRPVIHNATNLSRQMREPVLSLADDYDYRVHIVCVEASPADLARQNKERSHSVPEEAIGHLLGRWEAPTLAEAHLICHVP